MHYENHFETKAHPQGEGMGLGKERGADSTPGLPGSGGRESRAQAAPTHCPYPRPHLFPSRTEHGLLDVCVHAAESIIPSGDALQVAEGSVLIPHHLLHHGWIPSKLHRLVEKGERKNGPWNQGSTKPGKRWARGGGLNQDQGPEPTICPTVVERRAN